MKNIICTLFALLMAVSSDADGLVVSSPAYVSNTATWELAPVKLEVSKKATVLHFKVVNAKWGGWSLAKAQLVAGGDTLAYRSGRIITHDSVQVLKDEPFEMGRKYEEKDVRRDSLILTFEPLPKGTLTFDCLVNNGRRNREIRGIRADGRPYPSLLPPSQPLVDDDQPLKPLSMQLGEASATIRVHGGAKLISHVYSCKIWGKSYECSPYTDSVMHYHRPAYLMEMPFFSGIGFGLTEVGLNTQFPLVMIPGETLTLDIDAPAVMARGKQIGDRQVTMRDCYRVGGTIGDINQVLLENQELMYTHFHEDAIPVCTEGESFSEWSEQLWQNFDALLRKLLSRHPDYTRRQREFLTVWVNDKYVYYRQDYAKSLKNRMRPTPVDSLVAHLDETYTLADPHFNDMLLYRDGRTFYMPARIDHIPYLEANGLGGGEVCSTLRALDYSRRMVSRMDSLKVLSDGDIRKAHPLFQAPLREYNDSIRQLLERVRLEAEKRMLPAPDVPGDRLLETIVSQHPGKAVFIDLWATWCGPCRLGIDGMEPLKKQMKDRDVVFIYLTNETSPLGIWKKQVANIPGLHYRIPEKQWKQIPGLTAIPQYYLYDRQGKRVWEHVGYSDEVLKSIEQQLSEVLK